MLGSIVALFILAVFDGIYVRNSINWVLLSSRRSRMSLLFWEAQQRFPPFLLVRCLSGSAFHLFQQSDEVGVTNRMSLLRSPHFPLFHPILRNNGKWSSRNKTRLGLGPVTWCGNSETKRALITEPSRSISFDYQLIIFSLSLSPSRDDLEFSMRTIVSEGKLDFKRWRRRASSGSGSFNCIFFLS